MALTIPTATDEQISLEDYIERVKKDADPRDDESVCATAPLLRALANNRTFMAERLTKELLSWREFQTANTYTSQTFTFGTFGAFLVRANVWEPSVATTSAAVKEWHDDLFVYDLAHDHDFKFLTVGYFGAGYSTKLYEVEPGAVTGRIGERVPLEYKETTTLPLGKVMFYRAYRDVHAQAEPRELSISLNLMVATEQDFGDQHFFDLEKSTVTSCPPTNANGVRGLLCRLAQHLGDDRTVGALEEVSAAHPAHRVRVAALEALAGRAPESRGYVWKRALEDGHLYVRERAREELERDASKKVAVT